MHSKITDTFGGLYAYRGGTRWCLICPTIMGDVRPKITKM